MLLENVDYYFDENGNMVFTKKYHLKRGTCCKNGCRNCPWDYNRRKIKKSRYEK